MGAWGYKQIESDNGLDFIHGGLYKPDENGVVNIDRAVKKYMDFIYRSECNSIGNLAPYLYHNTKLHYRAVSEIIYEMNNNGDKGLSYKDDDYTKIKMMVISKDLLYYVISEVKSYLKENEKEHNWRLEDDRIKCINYLKKQLELLNKLRNNSFGTSVVVYERNKNRLSDYYRNKVKLTDNINLNRLRLFTRNIIVEDLMKGAYRFVNVTIEVYTDTKNNTYYKSVLHYDNGKQRLIAKANNEDKLVIDTLKSIGEYLYNKDVKQYLAVWKKCYNIEAYAEAYKNKLL